MENKVREMIEVIKRRGEMDGVCSIVWLNNLDGVCHINTCTDVLGAYVGEDDRLSISVSSADDKVHLFVDIDELPMSVAEEIYRQVMEKKIERPHSLKTGEVVFDNNKLLFGVIVDLKDGVAKIDMNGNSDDVPVGWCEYENRLMLDSEIKEDEITWETDDLDALYQIAWGVKDSRTENIVCYEHNYTRDEYPWFSPYLNENLFNFEVDFC